MLMIDYLIFGVIAISAVIGLLRGFFPELVSLAGWVVAIWSGWNYSSLIEPYLAGKFSSPMLELWVARAVVFVVVLLLAGMLGQLIALAIRKTGLSGTDRTLGLVFGIARGLIILGVAVLFAQTVDMQREPWWQQSAAIPYGERIAEWLHDALPERLAQHLPPAPETVPETVPDSDPAAALPDASR